MKYYQLAADGDQRLVARADERAYDLTSANSELTTFLDLLRASDIGGQTVDELTRGLVDESEPVSDEPLRERIEMPLSPDEVWAAGVTYKISEEAREEESGMADVYLEVYNSERPELFFKATESRTVGPHEPVGIRGDSDWNVPEPELAIVLYHGEVAGFTVGNDMSSRSIEGANPLYLPQAKVYDRCCAIGPCVVSRAAIDDPHDLGISMEIVRDDEVVYHDSTRTDQMVRDCQELADYYVRHNEVPRLAVVLTGTSLVPSSEFTLTPRDTVTIQIEGIGSLTNPVTVV